MVKASIGFMGGVGGFGLWYLRFSLLAVVGAAYQAYAQTLFAEITLSALE
jgi:hypothetical protein